MGHRNNYRGCAQRDTRDFAGLYEDFIHLLSDKGTLLGFDVWKLEREELGENTKD